ncbi:MAG: hypothetical protein O3C28_17255 [Proteobacteria bacterium]|nr:hypothetical protein [Pseudomonadota bacterium]
MLEPVVTYRIPARWFMSLLASISIPLVLLFVYPVAPQNGWWWDLLMAVGALAGGLILSAGLVAPRVWVHYGGTARPLRSVLFLHRDLSYVAVLLLMAHIFGLLWVDWTLLEYLKLSAPTSMIAGLAAAVLVLVVVFSSIYRIELGTRYRNWRNWHVGFSISTVVLMTWHILDAGYFFNSPIKKFVLVVLTAGPSLITLGAWQWHEIARAAECRVANTNALWPLLMPADRKSSLRIVILVVVFLLSCVLIFAVPKPESRAEMQAYPCVAKLCE